MIRKFFFFPLPWGNGDRIKGTGSAILRCGVTRNSRAKTQITKHVIDAHYTRTHPYTLLVSSDIRIWSHDRVGCMPLYEYRIVMSRVDATHHSQRSPFSSGPLPLSLSPLTGTAAVAAAAAPRRAARSERQHLVPARRNVRRPENAAVRAVDGHHVPEHAPRTHTHRPTISGSAAPAKL
ncbi:LAFE_0C07338g1_1 [Lachancea fermentati]|uniref:LAFE_0C07338g1_1 n=1 Tax=Lachancea fermentati TaxID=4955 RepID=A0A1G4M9S5_LACFM|nr:LAFE_0C07338g1_1 [Lachancea fermentati]